MRDLGNGDYLDDLGALFITVQQDPDPFDPPGTQGPLVRKHTGMYFLPDVPIYGLFGTFWKNDPLQFATLATASGMRRHITAAITATVEIYDEEVRVGPFSWRDKKMFRIISPSGQVAILNAGLEASAYARLMDKRLYPQNVRERIEREWAGVPA